MSEDWTKELARSIEALGIKTYPTTTYFFLANAPMEAKTFAKELEQRDIRIKVANQEGLGSTFVKLTTSTPENNEVVVDAIEEILEEH